MRQPLKGLLVMMVNPLESSDLMAGKVNPAPEDNVGHSSSTKAQRRDTQGGAAAISSAKPPSPKIEFATDSGFEPSVPLL